MRGVSQNSHMIVTLAGEMSVTSRSYSRKRYTNTIVEKKHTEPTGLSLIIGLLRNFNSGMDIEYLLMNGNTNVASK